MRTVCCLLILCATSVPWAGTTEGGYARYRVLNSSKHMTPPVTECLITVGPEGKTADGTLARWWSIRFLKKGGDFQIWCLSEQVPMRAGTASRAPGKVERYIYRENDRPILEYQRAHTGEALLPVFDWKDNFLPHPSHVTEKVSGWMASGRCLGHVLGLLETQESAEWDLPLRDQITVLALEDELLVATNRASRDINHGEKPDDDYTYRPLDQSDVEARIDAGFNMMPIHSPEMEAWVWEKPIFLLKPAAPYPEVFYRSTYLGSSMYIDEPAHHVGSRSRRKTYADIPRRDLMYDLLASFTEVALRKRAPIRTKAETEVNWGTLELQ